jgi:hypothetical protein
MAGFGGWLNESKLNLTEIATLRRSAVNLEGWPNIRSDNIGEYADVLQRIPCHQTKIAALDALYKLWSLYETQKKQAKSGVSATGWIVAGIAGLLLLLIFWVLWKLNLTDLGGDSTRGVLAFLFGLTTVGTIIIVVVAVFFEAGETTLDDRFQRGKDILTILIGLLGAILGCYFGQQANAYKPPLGPKTQQEGSANTGGQPGSSGALTK